MYTFCVICMYMYVCYSLLLFTGISVLGFGKKKEICSFETHISLILYFQYEDILCFAHRPYQCVPFYLIYHADSKDLF